MKINILGGSYEQKYKAANSQRSINWYPVLSTQQEQNKSEISLYPTPGLTTYVTLPGRYNRGLYTARTHQGTRCFAVNDNKLYEILLNDTYNLIGTLTGLSIGSSKVFMTCNLQNELFIAGYEISFVYNMSTGVLTEITDEFFPDTVTYATYLDQYTVVVGNNGAVFESETTSALDWNGSQTYSTTFTAAPVIAVVAYREQLYNFTTNSIEVFINDGTSPYSRLPRSSKSTGLASKDSLAVYADGMFFLGRDSFGETKVYYYDGDFNCTPISTPSINWQINNTSTPISDAYGWVQHTKDGHIWYYLTIPSLPYTFVYDMSTQEWHLRQSTVPSVDSNGDQRQDNFRANHYTNFAGRNLFTDRYSGKIFIEDYTNFTEDDVFIRRERSSQTFWSDDLNISVYSLYIDCTTGIGTLSGQGSEPILMLSWSKDGGYTFSQPKPVLLGARGNRTFRARVNKLGTGKNWVLKLVCTDPVNLILQQAVANGVIDTY